MELEQSDADLFLTMDKRFKEGNPVQFPAVGDRVIIPLMSFDEKENFLFDIQSSRFLVQKYSTQARVYRTSVLARLDFDRSPHTNPDGKRLGRTHLHLFREGYGDKWAHELHSPQFQDPTDYKQTFYDFMQFCHINEAHLIEWSVLS